MATDPKKPLDDLTPEQQALLANLRTEVRYDKITVSFSLEDRDGRGVKKSAFTSVTASRGHGAEVPQMAEGSPGTGYSEMEAKVVHSLVAKHVVAETYGDAVRRRIMSSETANEELGAILRAYDNRIVKVIQSTGK